MITIFLADDHPLIREGLHLLLSAYSDLNVVGETDNGHDALRQIEALCPQIALLDISMPGLNGLEVITRIRASGAATQVIVVSMYGSSYCVSRALRAGARGDVLKASVSKEIIDAIRTVHAGGYYLSRSIAGPIHEVENEVSLLARLS